MGIVLVWRPILGWIFGAVEPQMGLAQHRLARRDLPAIEGPSAAPMVVLQQT